MDGRDGGTRANSATTTGPGLPEVRQHGGRTPLQQRGDSKARGQGPPRGGEAGGRRGTAASEVPGCTGAREGGLGWGLGSLAVERQALPGAWREEGTTQGQELPERPEGRGGGAQGQSCGGRKHGQHGPAGALRHGEGGSGGQGAGLRGGGSLLIPTPTTQTPQVLTRGRAYVTGEE